MKHLLTCLTLLLSFSAQAQYVDGNRLLKFIDSELWSEKGFAQGYIAGVADSYDEELFCIPPRVTLGQLHDLATSFIRRNAKERHRHAGALVAIAFVEAYPCKKGGGV